MIAVLFIFAACIHSAAPTAPLSPTADCDTTQEWILAQPAKKDEPTPTFSGRCRRDIQFENVPRPADVITTLENNRVFLEMCVVARDKSVKSYAAELTITVKDWDYSFSGGNARVVVQNDTYGEHIGNTGSYSSGTVAYCIKERLERIDFPSPRPAVKADWDDGIYNGNVPYTIAWHYTFPADFEVILDEPPRPTIPQVFPGVGSQSDN